MRFKDYYKILGVSKQATLDEIKKSYRRLARECHPDFNKDDPEAEAKCKELNEAYEVLSNPDKRRQYDLFGASGSRFDVGGFGDRGVFEDLFGLFFDDIRTPGRPRAQRGSDLSLEMAITFEESVFGTEKEIEIPRLAACPSCQGSGAAAGSSPQVCPSCEGRGQTQTVHRGFFGDVVRSSVCQQCQGGGQILTKPCPKCKGEGRTPTSEKVSINIPAGVIEGDQLKMRGAGEAGRQGGAVGDLYIVMRVAPHAFFERKGFDLHCQVKISIVQAALGAEIEIPTIEGTTKLRIPAGTQNGTAFRMPGLGVPHRSGRGHQYTAVGVVIPTRLSREEKDLLKKFAASRGEDPRRPLEGLGERAKEREGDKSE